MNEPTPQPRSDDSTDAARAPWRGFQDTSSLTDLVLISGYSGAGKSAAMRVFEDLGYFCVDNLPPEMIRNLAELFTHEGTQVEKAAVVCDTRSGSYFGALTQILDELETGGVAHRVLFLDAHEDTLIRRFKETRRRHPLAPEGSVVEGITLEQEALTAVRDRAHVLIDTSDMHTPALREKIFEEMFTSADLLPLAVTFTSFGHKYGPVRDADLAFDVRFLPNPHWDKQLRPRTGQNPEVVEYINQNGALDAWYEHLLPMIDFLLPEYIKEGKSHLVVGIGCTGGRHRSVAIAERLFQRFSRDATVHVELVHRDIEKDSRVAKAQVQDR